jgi:hypothetical protein
VLAAQPLDVYVIEVDALVSVVDVSTGGIGGVSPVPIPVDAPVTCEIRSSGVTFIRISAKPVYCRVRHGSDGLFDVGLAFLDPAHVFTQASAGTLLEHVTCVLEFDEPPAL